MMMGVRERNAARLLLASSRLVIMVINSSINELATCVCVCVCLQHKWATLFDLTGFYWWCVHCWDKRQIHLCLILEEYMGGHHFSYYHPPIHSFSHLLKSHSSFTFFAFTSYFLSLCLVLSCLSPQVCSLLSAVAINKPSSFSFCTLFGFITRKSKKVK